MHLLRTILLSAVLLGGGVLLSFGVEIPLDPVSGSGNTSAHSSPVMGYVDMEVLFAQHPLMSRLKDDFMKEVEKRKTEVADLQTQIDVLHQIIISSTTDLAQARTGLTILRMTISTAAVASSPDQSSPLSLQSGVSLSTPTVVATPAVVPPVGATSPTAAATTPADAIALKQQEIARRESDLESKRAELSAKRKEIEIRMKQNKEDLIALEAKNSAAVLSDIYDIIQKISDEDGISVVLDKNNILCGQTCRDLTPRVLERLKGR